MIGTLAWREIRGLFLSPAVWLLLALSQGLTAWYFLLLVDRYRQHYQPVVVKLNSAIGVTDLVVMPFFGGVMMLGLLLMLAGMLAMRLFAEPRRTGHLQLMLAAPVSMSELVLGKFLGAAVFVGAAVISWSVMPLVLEAGANLDLGLVAAGVTGLMSLALVMTAMAVFVSALTAQPAVAAAGAFALGMALMAVSAGVAPGGHGGSLLHYLGLLPHYQNMIQGAVSSSDYAYFVLLIVGFLALAVRRLDALRTQGP